MDLAFEAVGSNGKLQIIMIAIIIAIPFTTLILNAGFPLLTMRPKLLCRERDVLTENFNKCSMESVCMNPEKYDIIKDHKRSLDNFSYKHDLYCSRAAFIPLIGSAYFLGAITGCIMFAPIPDRHGRIKMLKYLLSFNTFIHISLFLSYDILHIIVLTYFSGITSYSSSLSSILITEFIKRRYVGLFISLRSASFGLVGIFVSLFYMYVNNITVFFSFTSILSLNLLFLTNKYLVESPRWLNSKNRLVDTIEVFKQIAIINNRLGDFNKFIEINKDLLGSSDTNLSVIKHNYTLCQIYNYKSQQTKLKILIYIWFTGTFCFYGLLLNIGRSEENIFIESMVIFLAEIVAEIISGYLAGVFGRVTTLRFLSAIGGVGFISAYLINNKLIKDTLIFVTSFGFSGSVNILYILTPETFPTSIRSMTVTFLFLISRGGAVIVPSLARLTTGLPLLMGCMSLISSYLTLYLNETLGAEMQDDIPEFKRTYSVLSTSKLSFKASPTSQYFRLSQSIVSDAYFRLSIDQKKEIAHKLYVNNI